MNKKRKEKTLAFSALIVLILIISWSIIIYYMSPEQIIRLIGLNNGYAITFIGGVLGGTSLFFPFPNYLIVLTFGAAGLNPWLLAGIATAGVIIGESTSYIVGRASNSLLSTRWSERAHRLKKRLTTTKSWRIFILLILIGIVPIPNDYILVPLGLMRYPFWKAIIPLGIGNLFYNLILALAGTYGWILL